MKRTIPACLVALALGATVSPAKEKGFAPLREQILTAKSIFLSGGPPKVLDKAYAELKNWGRFQIVSDPAQADLVFDFRYAMERAPEKTSVSVYNPDTGTTSTGSAGTPGVWSEYLTVTDSKTKEVVYEDGRAGSPNFRTLVTHYSMAVDMVRNLRKRVDATEVAREWEYGIQVSNRTAKCYSDMATLDERLGAVATGADADSFKNRAAQWRDLAGRISTSQTEKDLANATADELVRKQNVEHIKDWRNSTLLYACPLVEGAKSVTAGLEAMRSSLSPDVILALDTVKADQEALGKDCSSELARSVLTKH